MNEVSQVLLAFRWYLAVQVFGLAALPLCTRLFRHLPDRGYGVSKPLGLLLAGWAFWLLTTFGWTHNTAGGILVAVVLLAVAGLLLTHYASRITNYELRITNYELRTVLITEVVFLLTFAGWCVVRAYMPRIETAGGEKWMEIAFLRAILRSETFPPHDPWLSGFAISYYYFGYVIVAMLTRLAAVPPSIAFNLGIATLFALTCTGAFCLVYNLIAVERREGREGGEGREGREGKEGRKGWNWGAVAGGLLGPLLVAGMGNLEGLLEVLHARGIGPASWWAWLDIHQIDVPPVPLAQGSWVPTRFFWWWQASRVLQDYTPWGAEQHVIDEFPAFSFILGDMHPHVLAVPFVILALALALNLYLRMANGEWRISKSASQQISKSADQQVSKWWGAIRGLRFADLQICRFADLLPFAPWELLVYALCLGGLGFLNTWDFPIYLFIVVAAYALALLRNTQHAPRTTQHVSRFTFHVLRFGLLFLALLLPGILLYLPFWLGFQSQAGGILLNLFNAARLPQFLVMFGPLVFIAVAFVAGQARQSGVRARQVVGWTVTVALGVLGVVAFVVVLAVLLVRLGAIPAQGAAAYVAAWLRGEPLPGFEGVVDAQARISRSLLMRLLNPWTAVGLIALLVTIVLTLRQIANSKSQIGKSANQQIANGEWRMTNGESPTSNLQPPTSNLLPPASCLLHPASCFALLLFATGALLTLSVEGVYLRDNFGTRMNTVFKFYFQAWVMWGVAAAYALATFLRRGRVGAVVVAVLLVAAGLIYPALAITERARESGGPPTLDGAAYLAKTQPDDYAAAAWLNEHVPGAPVILEAPGDRFSAYVYEGRVSAHTGLPTLLGWAGHEHQWRGNYDEQARREPDIETLYTSTERDVVMALLDKYNISYVYVGPVERARYPASGLAKFAGLMRAVYQTSAVTIYAVNEQ